MAINRRRFLQLGAYSGAFALLSQPAPNRAAAAPSLEALDAALHQTVVSPDLIPSPVTIDSMELITNQGEYLVRVRSRGGAMGIGVANSARMSFCYPIFLERVAPYFIGKDARKLDNLIGGVYLYNSNYKLQGLPFWISVAAAEMAVLDLLGQVAGKSIGEVLGGVVREEIPVYRATNSRGYSAEETIQRMVQMVDETDTQAVKFKLGARMYYTEETMARDKALIPLARKTFGEEMTIYSDANGSFDVPASVELGRVLEDHNINFFEEPCPFDHYEETRQIADTLQIRIAGGEQESSLHAFRWLIHHKAIQVVQPDLHYFGGYVRATRVARMADVANLPVILHISGNGLGYLQMMHFASCTSNIGEYQEYKGPNRILPFTCDSSDLRVSDSHIRVPSGPGFGITIDPQFLEEGTAIKG